MPFRRIFGFGLLMLTLAVPGFATHNRAGEITISQLGDLTVEITVITYTYTLSYANRHLLSVDWGDNTTSIIEKVDSIELPDYYIRNIYRASANFPATHTYSGYGVYEILVQDPNRNLGVKNIPNSVNVIFSIKTTINLNPAIDLNSNPFLLNYPVDRAARGQVFTHNPAAFDPDGDSLSYSLSVCTGEDGKPIENYTLPRASDTIFVNPLTGDLVWDTPVETGIYNVAMNIEEWRDGLKISNIVRDMQIEVVESDNRPPLIDSLPFVCALTGDSVFFQVSASDPDSDAVVLYASGGSFEFAENPSLFVETLGEPKGLAEGAFSWKVACNHVRDIPYQVVFKAEDIHGTLKSVSFRSAYIRVLGRQVQDVQLFPGSESISLKWAAYDCSNIVRFDIYRKDGQSDFVGDSCSNSIPEDFKKIGQTSGSLQLSFEDFRTTGGLQQGVAYCYIVVAVFANGAFESLSIPSAVVCGSLIEGTPTLAQVSVERFDAVNGRIRVAWIPPAQSVLDTLPGGAPFAYYLSRALPVSLSEYTLIDNSKTNLADTIYTDLGLNTTVFPFKYKIELYYTDSLTNTLRLAGGGSTAFSTYLTAQAGDNSVLLKEVKNAPWVNTFDSIFLVDPGTDELTLIYAGAHADSFLHTGLSNGETYTYEVHSMGTYTTDTAVFQTYNVTHRISAVPVDTVPPCPPSLAVVSNCDSLYNTLAWNFANLECAADVVGYRLYWSRLVTDNTNLFHTIELPSETSYIHSLSSGLGACYQVSAVDSFGNESARSPKVCTDVCRLYCIPPFFSPDGDDVNDFLRSCGTDEYLARIQVDMQIYSRWGMLVYETADPRINWDGRDRSSNKFVSTGVYYYICTVTEPRVSGLEVYNLTGFVHVFYGKNVNYGR